MKHMVPVWLTGGRILPFSIELRVLLGGGRDFVVLKARLLLAQHTVEMDLRFEEEGPKALYLHTRRGNVSLCQVLVLKASPSGVPGCPDTGGEGIWEKIKHEDMAVSVVRDINSLLARVTGQLGSYKKMNTVFLVPGCLVHKEPLVPERRGVTRAFHLVGQFPGLVLVPALPPLLGICQPLH